MVLDLIEIFDPDALGNVSFQQLADERLDFNGQITRVSQLSRLYIFKEVLQLLIEEGRVTDRHFEQHAADPVDVGREANALLFQHFGREVGRTAAEGHREAVFLAEAEVSKADVAVVGD